MRHEENRELRLAPWVRYYALSPEQLELLNTAGRALSELEGSLRSSDQTRNQIVHLTVIGCITNMKAIKRNCREQLGVPPELKQP